jgi:hypothetical protein
MIIGSLTPSEQATAIKEAFATSDVRTLIANHLGISVGRVTDEAHFSNDLGADWLEINSPAWKSQMRTSII